MKALWTYINGLKTMKSRKNRLYVTSLVLINTLIGAAAWLLLGRLFLPAIEWLLCFMGYPAVLVGLFGGLMYLYNHEFE